MELVFRVHKDLLFDEYIDVLMSLHLNGYKLKDGRSLIDYIPDPLSTYYIIADTNNLTVEYSTDNLGDGLSYCDFCGGLIDAIKR